MFGSRKDYSKRARAHARTHRGITRRFSSEISFDHDRTTSYDIQYQKREQIRFDRRFPPPLPPHPNPTPPPSRREAMDVGCLSPVCPALLSSVSGLSFNPRLLSALRFLYLVLLLFMCCRFSAKGPMSWHFLSRKLSDMFR